MAEKDLYAVLGVSRTATDAEIKKTYKKLARKFHPDLNPGDKKSEQRFKEVSAAYEVISDPDKRKLYDEFGDDAAKIGFDPEKARAYRQWQDQVKNTRGGRARHRGQGFQDFENFEGAGINIEDLLGDLFARGGQGGGRRRAQQAPFDQGPQPGADFEAEMTVELLDSLRGVEREIEVNGQRLRVKLPRGVKEGQKIRLKGQGAVSTSGGERGDLLITVRVAPHPVLRREGDDLFLDVPVTVNEAMFGAKIDIPTLEGSVKLTIPPRSQTGQKLRLKGKGAPLKNSAGDLYVVLRVMVPDADDPDEDGRRAAEALEKLYKRGVRSGLAL